MTNVDAANQLIDWVIDHPNDIDTWGDGLVLDVLNAVRTSIESEEEDEG